MSALDSMFLHVEDEITHMHIGSCAVCEGPAPAYDDIVSLIAGKLRLIPRYRRRSGSSPVASVVRCGSTTHTSTSTTTCATRRYDPPGRTALAGFAAPSLLALGLRAAGAMSREFPQRAVNTVTTNVPGPQYPLYAAGRQMLAYLPSVPLAQGVRVGVAILSYNGGVSFGVTGDYDSVTDLDRFCRFIESEISELRDCAGVAGPTGRRSRHVDRRTRPQPPVTVSARPE